MTKVSPELFANNVCASVAISCTSVGNSVSGEQRISNFLLWDIAYSELYFTNTLWPDFDAGELDKAIVCFNQRDRRYGGRDE
jgi:undecaprenyl diphosphate synthase